MRVSNAVKFTSVSNESNNIVDPSFNYSNNSRY
jgi:hypothetical protein